MRKCQLFWSFLGTGISGGAGDTYGKTPGSDRKLPEYPELYKGGDPDTDTFRQTCDPWEKPCDPLLHNP